MSDLVALRPGTILVDDYRIERVLGGGGFGITYLAEEVPLARLVTIKEYFPVDFAARDHVEDVVPRSQGAEGDYTWGLDRFLAEAQTLARFNHPNIVRVYRFFPARNTGYIVLHYEDGQSLKGWLRSLGRTPRQQELDRIVAPLLDALETVHAADYLHRDIAPDNIMIRRDGQPVLIDFGSARGDIARHSKTISALVKPGYSPYEQYATTASRQGPWTDIYSLGATLYEAITNRRPPDAPSRMVADELIPPADAALSSYRPQFLSAIARSLCLDISERPRTVAEWRLQLMAPAGKAAPVPEAEPAPSEAASRADPKPSPAPAAEAPVAAAAAPASDDTPRPGLAAAFFAGWRNGRSGDRSQAEREVPPAAPAVLPPKAPPASVPVAQRPRRQLWPWPRRAAAPAGEPGVRRATPKAFRKRKSRGWRSLAVKLAIGVGVAAGAVALQERIPAALREGRGLLTSQSGLEVPLAELRGHRGTVAALAFTQGGQMLVSVGSDNTLRVWSTTRAASLRTIALDDGATGSLAVLEGRAATGHKGGRVVLHDLATGARLAAVQHGEASLVAVSFAGNAERLAAAGDDGAVAVWSLAQPAAPEHVLDKHEGAVRTLAFSARGPFIASGGADSRVRLWNIGKGELVRTYRGHEAAVAATAFNPSGTVLASADKDGQIRLWSTFANRLKRRLKGHVGEVGAIVFAPDGEHLVSGGRDGTVRIWEASRGRQVRVLETGAGPITALHVSPDGKRIATAGADGILRLWEIGLPKAGS
jgi:hypothetical protein